MNRTTIPRHYRPDCHFLKRRPFMAFLILLIGCNVAVFADDPGQSKNSPGAIRATHLLGFEGVPNNANGKLTVSGDALQFRKDGKPAVEVKIAMRSQGSTVSLFQTFLETRRAVMRTFDTIPREYNASIISSIINLVCPQCGGSMMEFQCNGKCGRNWLAEWEWANYMTRSYTSRTRASAKR